MLPEVKDLLGFFAGNKKRCPLRIAKRHEVADLNKIFTYYKCKSFSITKLINLDLYSTKPAFQGFLADLLLLR